MMMMMMMMKVVVMKVGECSEHDLKTLMYCTLFYINRTALCNVTAPEVY